MVNTMATPAVQMFRRLEGLFCVYKPSGVHWKLVRDSIETNLLKGEDNMSFKNVSYGPSNTLAVSFLCLL